MLVTSYTPQKHPQLAFNAKIMDSQQMSKYGKALKDNGRKFVSDYYSELKKSGYFWPEQTHEFKNEIDLFYNENPEACDIMLEWEEQAKLEELHQIINQKIADKKYLKGQKDRSLKIVEEVKLYDFWTNLFDNNIKKWAMQELSRLQRWIDDAEKIKKQIDQHFKSICA